MANVEQDLQRIMEARYGRDVRQSIHDAIRDMNVESTHAEEVAISSQSSAQNNAILAESYTKGGTSTRPGEDTDNSKYYKEFVERIAGNYTVEDSLNSTSTVNALSANQGRVLNGKVTDIEDSVGSANGIASLDANGRVPSTQLPSYVDDVLEYASVSNFPATGESGKIYIALDTNKTYRWSGSAYVEISESLALGETSSTAYAGNKGKQNADDIDAIQEVIPFNASTSNKLATMADVGGGGHVIENQTGTEMTQRPTMQFLDATPSDDSTNEITQIEVVKQVTASELSSMPDGIYETTDESDGLISAEDVAYSQSQNVKQKIDEQSIKFYTAQVTTTSNAAVRPAYDYYARISIAYSSIPNTAHILGIQTPQLGASGNYSYCQCVNSSANWDLQVMTRSAVTNTDVVIAYV